MINRNRTSIRVNPLFFVPECGTYDLSKVASVSIVKHQLIKKTKTDTVEVPVTRWFFIEDTEFVEKDIDETVDRWYFQLEYSTGMKRELGCENEEKLRDLYERFINHWNRVMNNG